MQIHEETINNIDNIISLIFLFIFRLDSKRYAQKYGSIIFDFVYFKAANLHEQKIENDPVNIHLNNLHILKKKKRYLIFNFLDIFYVKMFFFFV